MTELEKLEKVLSSDLVLPQAKKEISEFIDFYYRELCYKERVRKQASAAVFTTNKKDKCTHHIYINLDQNGGTCLKCGYVRGNDYPWNGQCLNISCDLELANRIYFKIKEKYPDLEDMWIVDYLIVALYMINKNKVTDNVRRSRVRRLGLHDSFDNWEIKVD